MQKTLKEYPSLILNAFKRFPAASAFAIVTSFALIFSLDFINSKNPWLQFWFMVYPVVAMFISLTTSLIQEYKKNNSDKPQRITGIAWLVISVALLPIISIFASDGFAHGKSFIASALALYITAFMGPFVIPFFKQKNDNAFWIFLHKNMVALCTAVVVTIFLTIAIEILIVFFVMLLGINTYDLNVYAFIFCIATVLPILYFTNIPTIDECIEKTPLESEFATSKFRFLFSPIFTLSILLFYIYIVKFIVQWELPHGMISYLVSVSMFFMIATITEMYPAHLKTTATIEKKLLKIFPIFCIPLVVLMSISILRRISDYGISENRIYVIVLNIYFYIVIAILLIDKIKCKSRYLACILGIGFLILTIGPLSASNITYHVWSNGIKTAIEKEGFSNLPLSKEETKIFLTALQKKDDHKSALTLSRISFFEQYSTKNLGKFFFTDDVLDFDKIRDEAKGKVRPKSPTTLHSVNIYGHVDDIFEIPKNTSKVIPLNMHFDKDDFKVQNDSLFFQVKVKRLDKTFQFAEPITDNPTSFSTNGAILIIKQFFLLVRDTNGEISSDFTLKGFLFVE